VERGSGRSCLRKANMNDKSVNSKLVFILVEKVGKSEKTGKLGKPSSFESEKSEKRSWFPINRP